MDACPDNSSRPPAGRTRRPAPPGGARVSATCLAAVCIGLALLSAPAPAVEPVRLVLFTVRIGHVGTERAKEILVRVPYPVTNRYQQILSADMAPAPERLEDTPAGKAAFLRFADVAPGDSVWVLMLIRCRLRPFEPRPTPDPKPLPPADRAAFLAGNKRLDLEAPVLARTHAELGGDAESPFERVTRINRFFCEQFTYELDDTQNDAATVLETRRGSCSELARAFAALCRYENIPARFAAGSRLRTDVDGYADTVRHRWVEVHTESHGWFPVDISRNVSRAEPEFGFGAIGPTYLCLSRAAGDDDDPLRATATVLLDAEAAAITDRTVRIYWFRGPHPEARRLLRRVRAAGNTPLSREAIRRELIRADGAAAAPFAAMALYAPLAGTDRAEALDALARNDCPAAVSALVDYLGTGPPDAATVSRILQAKTALGEATPDEWRARVRAGGGIAPGRVR